MPSSEAPPKLASNSAATSHTTLDLANHPLMLAWSKTTASSLAFSAILCSLAALAAIRNSSFELAPWPNITRGIIVVDEIRIRESVRVADGTMEEDRNREEGRRGSCVCEINLVDLT